LQVLLFFQVNQLRLFRIQEDKEDTASLLEDKAKTLKAAYYHKTYGFYLLLSSFIFLASKSCKILLFKFVLKQTEGKIAH
jgi:hypothetical protein